MSILNLGLQYIGLMREKMDENFKKLSSRCNSLADLRKIGEGNPSITDAVADSISPVKVLLTDIFVRLELQSKKFSFFTLVSSSDISLFWEAMLSIDSALTDPLAKYRKATLAKNKDLRLFLNTAVT